MEETRGIAAAVSALGNALAQLEQELYYERLAKENAENRASKLAEENERLMKKLDAVEAYMEGLVE